MPNSLLQFKEFQSLSTYPVNYYDLKNDYEFDDNQIIKIAYGIIKPNPKLQTAEFTDYFMEIRKKNILLQ